MFPIGVSWQSSHSHISFPPKLFLNICVDSALSTFRILSESLRNPSEESKATWICLTAVTVWQVFPYICKLFVLWNENLGGYIVSWIWLANELRNNVLFLFLFVTCPGLGWVFLEGAEIRFQCISMIFKSPNLKASVWTNIICIQKSFVSITNQSLNALTPLYFKGVIRGEKSSPFNALFAVLEDVSCVYLLNVKKVCLLRSDVIRCQ